MKIFLFISSLYISSVALAQSGDEQAVRATITQMFDGMRKADTTLFKAVFAPNTTLQTVAKNKEVVVSVRQDAIAGFITSVAKQAAGTLDERLSGMDIKIDGELATAWTPYTFYYNKQKSHCGVNAFALVKLNGVWKIQNIIDTRRRENCPDL